MAEVQPPDISVLMALLQVYLKRRQDLHTQALEAASSEYETNIHKLKTCLEEINGESTVKASKNAKKAHATALLPDVTNTESGFRPGTRLSPGLKSKSKLSSKSNVVWKNIV
jgi:hypothetical protein